MIRQSQEYFAAAASAAALNAAAVAAFVVFTMLSSVGGFPLQDLFSSGNTVTSASSSAPSGDGEAPPSDTLTRSFGSRSAFGTSGSGGPAAPNTNQAAFNDGAGPRSSSGGGPSGGGGSPPAASTGSTGNPGGGEQLPNVPGQSAAAQQQVGNAVTQAPSAVNQAVGKAVDSADDAVDGGLTQTGVKQTVEGASNSLLGQGSAVDQAAKNVSAALQAATNRVATAPSAPVSAPPLG